ncbi:MAG: hypothetical protein ACFFBD_12340 [Candidatus Hodarchaeota archaeon]
MSALYLAQARFTFYLHRPSFPPFESCYRLIELLFTFKIERVSWPTWITHYRTSFR